NSASRRKARRHPTNWATNVPTGVPIASAVGAPASAIVIPRPRTYHGAMRHAYPSIIPQVTPANSPVRNRATRASGNQGGAETSAVVTANPASDATASVRRGQLIDALMIGIAPTIDPIA